MDDPTPDPVCCLEVGAYSYHRGMWVPFPQGGRWSWWRETCSLSASPAQIPCREERKGTAELLSRRFLMCFLLQLWDMKIKCYCCQNKGLLPLASISFPSHPRISALTQSRQACTLLHTPSFFFWYQRLLHSKVPGFWKSLNLGLSEDKKQMRGSGRTSRNHGFFFVISLHIFLIAYNEEIPPFKSENLATIFLQSGLIILSVAYNNS